MEFDERLPDEHLRTFVTTFADGQTPRFCCRADLDRDGHFANSWVAVNEEHIVCFEAGREPIHLRLESVTEVKIVELFGASRLVAVCGENEHSLARYSHNRVAEFAAVCRMIDQLREGQMPTPPEELKRAFCQTCRVPLSERGATCPRCLSRGSVLLRLIKLVQPYRWQAIGLISVTIVSVGAAMVPPLMFKRIADRAIAQQDYRELAFCVGFMGLAFFAERTLQFCGTWMNVWLSSRVVADMRTQLHERAQRLRMSYHNRHESGELVGRIMNDTGELQHFLADGLPYFLVNSISFVSIAVIMLLMNWRLALLVFVPVPILLLGGKFFWNVLRPMFHKHGNRIGALHSMLGESLGGVRTVKSMAQEDRRAREFNVVNERVFRINTTVARTFTSFSSTMGILMAVGTLSVWYFGGRAVISSAAGDVAGGIQIGTLLAFVGFMALFYGPLQWFGAVFNWMTNSMTAAERIFAVLDQPTELYVSPDAVKLPRGKGAISLRNVRFSYERGHEVIKDISLDIEPGSMVGLVGRSGSGKSTIINLVCRFYDPDSGTVTIDGHDLREVNVHSWRTQVGIVMQSPFLFHASICDNIRYGKPTASFDDVMRAARAAHAHEFICEKEEGYDTILGEGGGGLSGGEQQRIAIARAILHDPPVLILDEATSAVDSQTEKSIQEAIANLVRGRTTIAIAHRLATLRNADRLVVVEDGKIIERGTHAELLAKEDGKFAALVKLQTEINQLRSEQVAWAE